MSSKIKKTKLGDSEKSGQSKANDPSGIMIDADVLKSADSSTDKDDVDMSSDANTHSSSCVLKGSERAGGKPSTSTQDENKEPVDGTQEFWKHVLGDCLDKTTIQKYAEVFAKNKLTRANFGRMNLDLLMKKLGVTALGDALSIEDAIKKYADKGSGRGKGGETEGWSDGLLVGEKAIKKQKWRFLHERTLQNILGATLDDGFVLRAQEDFLADGETGSKIYVRKCYEDWFEMIRSRTFMGGFEESDFEPSDLDYAKTIRRSFIIQGPPGVGKTTFVPFLIWSILTDETDFGNTTVVYRCRDSSQILILSKQNGVRVEENNNPSPEQIEELADPKAIYICDAQTQAGAMNDFSRIKAFLVYLTSPDFEGIKSLRKAHQSVIYCHNWTWEEVETAYTQVCSPNWTWTNIKTLADVKKRYVLWGGNPRNIFTYSREDLEEHLKDGTNPDRLLKAVHSVTARKDVSHRFLRYEVEVPVYWKMTVKLSSDYIADTAYELDKISQRKINRKFILDHFDDSSSHGYLGQLLEPEFHWRMRLDGLGTITVEEAGDSKKTCMIKFPTSGMKLFTIVEEGDVANQPDGHYGQPFKGNFPSIDAFVAPNIFLQVNIGETHPVKAEPLRKLVSAADRIPGNNSESEYKLIFVTIPENKAFHGEQRYIPLKPRNKSEKKTGHVAGMKKLPVELKRVKQYIYRMDISVT